MFFGPKRIIRARIELPIDRDLGRVRRQREVMHSQAISKVANTVQSSPAIDPIVLAPLVQRGFGADLALRNAEWRLVQTTIRTAARWCLHKTGNGKDRTAVRLPIEQPVAQTEKMQIDAGAKSFHRVRNGTGRRAQQYLQTDQRGCPKRN